MQEKHPHSGDGNKKKKPIVIRILRALIIFFLSLFMLILATTAILYLNRDTIGKKILLHANDLQDGELSFADISFNPFVHFPVISVHLSGVIYRSGDTSVYRSQNDTLAQIDDFYGALNLLDLIKGDINVTKITLDEGWIGMNKYEDGSIDLLNAFGYQEDEIDSNEVEKSTPSGIRLDEISLRNILISYSDSVEGDNIEVLIDRLDASFFINSDSIFSNLETKLQINQLLLKNKVEINDKHLALNTTLLFDQSLKKVIIDPSKLMLENLNFNIDGFVEIVDSKLDLNIAGSDEDFSLFRIILTESGLNNLKSGSAYFKGTVKGNYNNQIPVVEVKFGLKNVTIQIPETEHEISELSLNGYFNSGRKVDLSSARLKVNNLRGLLPGGYIKADLSMRNFKSPVIDYLVDLETDLKGLDEIFNFSGIKDLKGNIRIYDEFRGTYDEDHFFTEETSVSEIIFDSISFHIPEVIEIENLTGGVNRIMDTINIKDLTINTVHSDINLEGQIISLFDLIFDRGKEITADLHIVSDTLDLPALFAFEPIVARIFPFRLLDFNSHFSAETNRSKLLNFSFNPEIFFKITDSEAVIEDVLPKITVEQGDVLLAEKEERIYMEFTDFKLESKGALVETEVEYFSPEVDPDFISVNAVISDLNPGKIFLFNSDSVPSWMEGNLSGSIQADLEVGLDTLDFESLNIRRGDLSYLTDKDTFNIQNLLINADEILIGQGSEEQALENISFTSKIRVERIQSNYINLDDVSYDLVAESGTFTVGLEEIRFFGKEGQGYARLSPSADPQEYELKYSIEGFQIEHLLNNLLIDTIITGFIDLETDISLTISDDENPYAGLNGITNITGTEMTLYGLDIDNLIKKYNRSQKFNLADLGAVIVAGPYGLAITKGTDFTRLALTNTGEKSTIVKFVSDWNIENGRMILSDVAFSTRENRIAGKGWIDLPSDSLEITFAVIDKNGCSVLSQKMFGSIQDPQYSEIKIVGTFLGPVTNLIDGALGKDCEIFYDGQISHPVSKKRKQ